MENHSGQSISVWMETGNRAEFPKLSESANTDVCVIGAGIAGLTTAYMLISAGKSVIVLDDGPIISGESERTTAHLTCALDNRYYELEKLHGTDGIILAAQSHSAAIDKIEQIIGEEKIDCGFERLDGYLFVPPGESIEALKQELAAAHRGGLSEVELVARAPIETFDTGPALLFPRQGQFHPIQYLSAIARAILKKGGNIYSHTHAVKMEGGHPAHVTIQDGPVIIAQSIVVATNTPVNDWVKIHTKQAPYRTYVIGALIPPGSLRKALYWDTADPYHYVRLQSIPELGDLLIIGGEDHKTGQADDAEKRFERLEQWSRERFPMLQEVRFRWSGQIMEPVDGLGFIGHNPKDKENVYIITGDSGNGTTNSTLGAMLISDLILGRGNEWARLYDPARKNMKPEAVASFLKENLNVACLYSDWITPGDVRKDSLVPPDTGAITRKGLKKLAVYRDEAGHLHEYSAVCPHLGCIFRWNHFEKTWDCPCHGSRFDRFGKVINGPANIDLKETPSPNK